MADSPEWVVDQIGIGTADDDRGLFGYLLRRQRLAKKTLHLCLSLFVAPEVVPRRNGVETEGMIIGKRFIQT